MTLTRPSRSAPGRRRQSSCRAGLGVPALTRMLDHGRLRRPRSSASRAVRALRLRRCVHRPDVVDRTWDSGRAGRHCDGRQREQSFLFRRRRMRARLRRLRQRPGVSARPHGRALRSDLQSGRPATSSSAWAPTSGSASLPSPPPSPPRAPKPSPGRSRAARRPSAPRTRARSMTAAATGPLTVAISSVSRSETPPLVSARGAAAAAATRATASSRAGHERYEDANGTPGESGSSGRGPAMSAAATGGTWSSPGESPARRSPANESGSTGRDVDYPAWPLLSRGSEVRILPGASAGSVPAT